MLYLIEILHQTTTSLCCFRLYGGCILSKFYIKPQPLSKGPCIGLGCILSKFYIKPQHNQYFCVVLCVVSYRNSTSNHNTAAGAVGNIALYLIEILHQTTTNTLTNPPKYCCILSKFYIKPQHSDVHFRLVFCCILSKFYIKPQLIGSFAFVLSVVSYRNSTSNHNVGPHID